MKYLLLTFDIEEFDELRVHNIQSTEEERCRISAQGLKDVVNLLKKQKIKATFFTTYIFAMHHSELIKKIIREKHEIGLHAYSHSHDYTKMPEEESYAILKEAKEQLEKKFKVKLKGFRGPQMRRPSYKVLGKLGFIYDSSVHPTWMLGKISHITKPRKMHKTKEGIIEVPLSVSPLLRLAIAWIHFRNLPLIYTKLITKMIMIDTNILNMYFHPWDFTDINKPRFKKLMFLIRRNTGKKNLEKLEKFIVWCKTQKYQAITMSDYISHGIH